MVRRDFRCGVTGLGCRRLSVFEVLEFKVSGLDVASELPVSLRALTVGSWILGCDPG